MPLFEVGADELVPFRRVKTGDGLYEKEIEVLMWDNLELFTGETLFRVRRQAPIQTGGKPDILALDQTGCLHVVEIKRDTDRGQLSQCLEYAGWALNASLDELAGLYEGGVDEFFADWMEFTETPTPVVVQGVPRLVLVARDFNPKTEDALSYLSSSSLPITVLPVTIYADDDDRRVVHVDAEHEPSVGSEPGTSRDPIKRTHLTIDGRRVLLADLVDAGLLSDGEILSWYRPRVDTTYTASVRVPASLELQDGRMFSTPSRAADEAVGKGSYDGWHAWKTADGNYLHALREKLVADLAAAETNGEASE